MSLKPIRDEIDQIDQQLKTEFVDALSPAFGALAALELRPSQIPTSCCAGRYS